MVGVVHQYTGEPQYIELTIPFTNNTIKISPYSVYGRWWLSDDDNPTDNTAITIVRNLMGSVWWFLIGYWVLKDIRGTINKVAEGNIENASSDIKKEIL